VNLSALPDSALLELAAILRKYSPDQPRVPAGSPDGGQFGDGGAVSDTEFRALREYADQDYTGINGTLRGVDWRSNWGDHHLGNTPPPQSKVDRERRVLDKMMSTHTLPAMTLNRGVNQVDGFATKDLKAAVGTVISDKGFISTTKFGSSVTDRFGSDIMLRIQTNEGTHGLDLTSLKAPIGGSVSLHPNEGEVLLDRGLNMRIDSVGVRGDKTIVTVTVVP
jgi:hypothetical protein